jgi:hypothetical protein
MGDTVIYYGYEIAPRMRQDALHLSPLFLEPLSIVSLELSSESAVRECIVFGTEIKSADRLSDLLERETELKEWVGHPFLHDMELVGPRFFCGVKVEVSDGSDGSDGSNESDGSNDSYVSDISSGSDISDEEESEESEE